MNGADAKRLRKILKSEVKGTYPETKTVLVRELIGGKAKFNQKGNKGILRNQR